MSDRLESDRQDRSEDYEPVRERGWRGPCRFARTPREHDCVQRTRCTSRRDRIFLLSKANHCYLLFTGASPKRCHRSVRLEEFRPSAASRDVFTEHSHVRRLWCGECIQQYVSRSYSNSFLYPFIAYFTVEECGGGRLRFHNSYNYLAFHEKQPSILTAVSGSRALL